MTITVAWDTKIIDIPKVDMTLIQSVPTEIRELDLDVFRLTLKALEADEEGMPFVDTHRHNTEVLLSGITYARVFEIINGYTVTFEDGQYAVNLVNANSNVGDVVNVNQVSIRSNNSAGLISSPAIEYASFGGGVTINISTGVSGTLYPTGTPQQPSDNVPDALLIATFRGFTRLFIEEDITLDTGHDVSNFHVEGHSHASTMITINPGCVCDNTEFLRATITGTLDGGSFLFDCMIETLNFVNGHVHECMLGLFTITLGGSADSHFVDCKSGVPGTDTPIIDMGGSGNSLGIRGYHGGIKLINKSGADKVSIDMDSGHIILADTITNGDIVLRGTAHKTDNSVGANVIDNLDNPENISDAVWDENVADHVIDGSTGEEQSNIIKTREDLFHIIETQKGHHTAHGNIFYWDPINGSDSNNGLSHGTAKLTWGGVSGTNSLVTAYDHDVVIIVPGELGGITVVTEQIILDKEYTFLRGPGRDVKFKPVITTNGTIQVDAVGCELTGMLIETADTGDGEALIINGTFPWIHDIWVEKSQGDGIRLQNVSYATLEDVFVRNCSGNGVVFRGIAQDSRFCTLYNSNILQNTGHGVVFDGVNCQNNLVWGGDKGVFIAYNTGWGIWEQNNADFNHVIGPTVSVHDNTGGSVSFIGSSSESENIGSFLSADVWDETTADHTTGGTFGGEVATKSDIQASSSTVDIFADSGTIVQGSLVSGSYSSTFVRDGTYWQILEDGTNGITVEFVFTILNGDCRPGVFEVFGRYEGNPANVHYQELWAWNVESVAWEKLVEVFMPGGNTSDDTHIHEYFERHINRTNGEVKIRTVHNVTTYNTSHNIYFDLVILKCIEVITAADIADAVWDEATADHISVDTFGGYVDQQKKDMERMLGLGNENVKWSDMTWDTATNPPRMLTGKINLYSDDALTIRKIDSQGNIVYQLTQEYHTDGSTKNLSSVRII